jgi:hypothetical protein
VDERLEDHEPCAPGRAGLRELGGPEEVDVVLEAMVYPVLAAEATSAPGRSVLEE